MKILASDTETTGTDFFHGCAAYLVTAYDGKYDYLWDGTVSPQRVVRWDKQTVDSLQYHLDEADVLVFHSTNFDRRALESIGIKTKHLIPKIEDTLLAAHLVCSGDVHGLKPLAKKYLRMFNDDEILVQQATLLARERNKDTHMLAKEGCVFFPGVTAAGKSLWKADMWMTEEVKQYGSWDVRKTYYLWKAFLTYILHFGLIKPYAQRKRLLPVVYDMQTRGINIYMNKVMRFLSHMRFQLKGLENLIKQEANWIGPINLESKTDLTYLLYNERFFNLPIINTTDTGAASTDKETIQALIDDNPKHKGLRLFARWGETSTEIEYVDGWRKWSTIHKEPTKHAPTNTPPEIKSLQDGGMYVVSTDPSYQYNYRLHSTINITGTKWTRQSSSDPNQQNFKKELAYMFGPPEGYYWLYMDVVNIELRIWAYEVNSRQLIEAFERGESVHMIIARAIRPHQIAAAGGESAWKSTDPIHKQYTKTKGGTFSKIYGASDSKANKTYGIDGAMDLIRERIPEVASYFEKLQAEMYKNEEIYGYPTIFTIDGYKLEVPRNKPYIAPSARIQGSASTIVQDMMIQITSSDIYLENQCNLIQQVHDSLTIEIPFHENSEQTNKKLITIAEQTGMKYIPTCPLDAEVILPHQDVSFRLKMPTVMKDDLGEHKVSFFFSDHWIAQGKFTAGTQTQITEAIGNSEEEAYNNLKIKLGM